LSQIVTNPNVHSAAFILIQEALSLEQADPGRTLTVRNAGISGIEVGDWEITTRRIKKPS
jgi:hypothetical protein